MSGNPAQPRCIPFDVFVEPSHHQDATHLAWRIRAPGIQMPEVAVDPGVLVDSWLGEGTHWIFTCGCGSPDCADIEEGVVVRRLRHHVTWTLHQPYFPAGWRDRDERMQRRTYRFDAHDYHRAIVRALEQTEPWDLRTTTLGPYGLNWPAWLRRHLESRWPA